MNVFCKTEIHTYILSSSSVVVNRNALRYRVRVSHVHTQIYSKLCRSVSAECKHFRKHFFIFAEGLETQRIYLFSIKESERSLSTHTLMPFCYSLNKEHNSCTREPQTNADSVYLFVHKIAAQEAPDVI